MTRIGTDGGFALPEPDSVIALDTEDVETATAALACMVTAAEASDEPEIAVASGRALRKFRAMLAHQREHDDPSGVDVQGPFSLQELLAMWRRGDLSDARLVEAITGLVGALNATFDVIREGSEGAIDAHASVRMALPRRKGGEA